MLDALDVVSTLAEPGLCSGVLVSAIRPFLLLSVLLPLVVIIYSLIICGSNSNCSSVLLRDCVLNMLGSRIQTGVLKALGCRMGVRVGVWSGGRLANGEGSSCCVAPYNSCSNLHSMSACEGEGSMVGRTTIDLRINSVPYIDCARHNMSSE